METNRKTIQINPELFKMNGGGNTTRKKQKKINDIRIKTKTEKPKNMSTIKRNILKMIRNHQEDRRKNRKKQSDTDTDTDTDTDSITKPTSISLQFQNEFNESLEYLSKLTKDVDNKKQSYTIKRYPSTSTTPVSTTPLLEPTYGCLKNGKLPTYRTWLTQTRKNNPSQQTQSYMQPQIIIQNPPTNNAIPFQQVHVQGQPVPQVLQQQAQQLQPPPLQATEISLNENLKQFSKIQQFERKNNQNLNLKKWKYPKQKRTIRRTYFVGRSRVHPRISVLVSNKTIRARTTLKQQELKQVPIAEVKKYLLKNGFIKVGTSSPNDVLREMYENAQLICGEIKNHNPENLLYNYFNAPPES